MEKEEAIRRLAFIKYLYNLGVDQSKRSEPYSWASLLTFHDTVELFLVLAAEFLDVPMRLRALRFNEYWEIINPVLEKKKKKELTQRISMEKLNDSRVAFKHHGTPPSTDTVSNARVNVANFLEENTFLIFDIQISEVSLIDLVECKGAKVNLNEAVQLLSMGEKENAVDRVALAFHRLIDDYIDRKKDAFGRSPFRFGNFFGFSTTNDLLSEVESAFDEVEDALDDLGESVSMLALGLDYRKYVRFRLLTARNVLRKSDGKYEIQRRDRGLAEELADEDVKYCVDFVVECALVFKEFDFELKPRKPRPLKDIL